MIKYFQDFLSYTLSHILGGRKYETWAQNALTLQKNIPIKNKKLAQELEAASETKGFLSYKEFLTIDQFGKYGYHSTHKEHGMTDVISRWPEALLALCKQKNIHSLVEFGPGNGKAGTRTLSLAKKEKYPLFWSGVEISDVLKEQAQTLFRKKGLEKYLVQLVSTIEELSFSEKCLFVFSYSLDNLIPDVFINTRQEDGYPHAMVGVTVKNGLLSEIIIPLTKFGPLSRPELSNKGIFVDEFGYSWDMRKWQLHPMQRVYMPLTPCQVLLEAINAMPFDSQILIIDEFRIPTHQPTYHLGIPRDLETYSRDFVDLKKFYKTAGSNLLYFPIFLSVCTSLFSQAGFALEENTGERKLASTLSGRSIPLPKHPHTLALLTSPKKKGVGKKNFIVSSMQANN